MTACGCNCCEACLKASIERGQAEAVRMLDQWTRGAELGKRQWMCSSSSCVLVDMTEADMELKKPSLMGADMSKAIRKFDGDSPEAARANAAEAIRSELT